MNKKGRATPIDTLIGERLKRFRVEAGKSQEELAHLVDITFQQIQKYENGKNRISASRLVDVACALGRRVQDFYPEEATGAKPVFTQGMTQEVAKDISDISLKLQAVNRTIQKLARAA